MYVKDCMTKNPICLTPLDSILDAFGIMKKGNFHRLPIVEDGKIVGLITGTTLSDFAPSKATTLAVYEINSILAKTRCGDIMIKDVQTIKDDALLEEAADKMYQNDITCLPVVDDDNNVIGIITQKVIFAGFVEVQGYYNKGTRLVVQIDEDRPGILKEIATILSAEGINITHLVVERNSEGTQVVIRVSDTDAEKVVKYLGKDFKIVDVRTNS